jgi:hypothetical protein
LIATPRLDFDKGLAFNSHVCVQRSRHVAASIATVTLSIVKYIVPLYTSGLVWNEPTVFER